ncbi:hypothetical protein [Streptomyces albipurpureus]|uniref:GNAT family N-acetyltransferase n=1 Tax=Streptomyces albipurpureus TaxID=2897419 RepID=A0ABT0UGT2_9ACTN|nr:hypothetical protein [Streptomyces sp. CWNU-1]MCM2387511.1 hypothetical protein [Streptomyces sp. CWNU-1]
MTAPDARAPAAQATLTGDWLDTFLDGRLLTAVRPVDGPRPSWFVDGDSDTWEDDLFTGLPV